jgi:RNA-directed DNA polymerase
MVVERLIQQASAPVLGPLFDPAFSASSFGFRPERSAHQAVKQRQGYIKRGYKVAGDIDLAKFFDLVSHEALMARVARKVRTKALSNVMFDDLDKDRERRDHRFARYGDDFLLVLYSRRAGEHVTASLTRSSGTT